MTGPIPPDAWPPITITPREVYDVASRVSVQVTTLSQQLAQYEMGRQDHENRLRVLESRPRWPLASVTTLAAVAAVVVAVITLLVRSR